MASRAIPPKGDCGRESQMRYNMSSYRVQDAEIARDSHTVSLRSGRVASSIKRASQTLVVMLFLSLVLGCALPILPGAHNSPDRVKPRYNYMEKEYELAPQEWILKYNYMEKEYQYAPKDSKLKYNYMEERYEFVPRKRR